MSKKNKSIAILICYYGKLPWYFTYFLHSCTFNNTIDFYFISDIQIEFELPKNVKYIYKSLREINSISTNKLGFKTSINEPYKLCDFKPAYGIIFSDLIKNYDYWGYSDIDIIYGNIRAFLNKETLEAHDYLSVRHDYTTGCFSLFRNCHLANNLFKESKDYKHVLSSPQHFCFDECNFKQYDLTEGKLIFDLEREIDCFTYVIKKAHTEGRIKAHFDFILIEGLTGKIKFDKGKIFYNKMYEAIMYHLFLLKRVYSPKKQSFKIPDTFYISPTRIYT